jgi:hypothetical protein
MPPCRSSSSSTASCPTPGARPCGRGPPAVRGLLRARPHGALAGALRRCARSRGSSGGYSASSQVHMHRKQLLGDILCRSSFAGECPWSAAGPVFIALAAPAARACRRLPCAGARELLAPPGRGLALEGVRSGGAGTRARAGRGGLCAAGGGVVGRAAALPVLLVHCSRGCRPAEHSRPLARTGLWAGERAP